jgi:quinolinate synthase
VQPEAQKMYEEMKSHLANLVPDFELAYKAEIAVEINELKKERNAVILGHNYMEPVLFYSVPDFKGDSLDLSRKAAQTDKDVIVFCGVRFMAETAKILSPRATVLMPDPNAGCPMANMVTVRELCNAKAAHPDAVVVCYVNSSAAVKAESDICCTSANAVKVVASVPKDREVLFVPDRNLGAWVEDRLGRKLILWDGYCPTHQRILPEFVAKLKREHPGALVVVHPECTRETIALADDVASTTGILKFCRESGAKEFIIGTEVGILHRLRKESPAKTFYEVSPLCDCPNMKLTTLEKVLWSLEDMQYEVTVPEDILDRKSVV